MNIISVLRAKLDSLVKKEGMSSVYRLLLIAELILLLIALLYFMDGLRDLMRYYNTCPPMELIWI